MTTQSRMGAVCYIDLLGFSYLTTLLENKETYYASGAKKSFGETKIKDLTLSDFRYLDDYIKFGDNVVENKTTVADWAYNIVDKNLKTFHKIVERQCSMYQNAEYSVISDSLFIVDDSSDEILFILSNIFRECIKNGILLRAGLAYGAYYSVKTHIANFNAYGTTVTKAVKYEKQGKGCRIFTDSDFPHSCKSFSETNSQLFWPYKNYQDYSVLDCFEWLMIKDEYVLNASDISKLVAFKNINISKEIFDLFEDNYEVLCNLLYSPDFEWNLKNDDGIVQLGASIEYISALIDKTYTLYPNVEASEYKESISDGVFQAKNQKRTEKILQNMILSKKKNVKNIFGLV